ncbi:MAG: TetR/AcrR family transcriptional regulator [Actinoallomurus sp.]
MDKPGGQAERPTSAEQGVATRKAIVDAALALIGEVGWGQVTTRAIASRAGVPHGAVGYHFNGKAELLREAATAATTQALAEPITLARHAGSLAELVEGTFAWYSGGGISDPSVALLLEVTREAVRDDALRESFASVLRDYRAALTDLVRADQERGAVPPDADSAGTAAVVAALMDGLLLHLILDPHLDIQATASAVRTLLGGNR